MFASYRDELAREVIRADTCSLLMYFRRAGTRARPWFVEKDPEKRLLIGQNRCAVCTGPRELILPLFVPDDTRCAPNAISKCQSLHIYIEERPGMGIIAPPPRSGVKEGMKGASSVENLQDLAGRRLTGHRKPGRNGERGA